MMVDEDAELDPRLLEFEDTMFEIADIFFGIRKQKEENDEELSRLQEECERLVKETQETTKRILKEWKDEEDARSEAL